MSHRTVKFIRIISLTLYKLVRIIPFVLLVVALFFVVSLTKKISASLSNNNLTIRSVKDFLQDPKQRLENTNNRTNFLIVGIRGEGSDSPDLADSMSIISYSYLDRSYTLVSVPRDLWVNSLKTKINATYHYGNFKEENGGIKLLQASILETLGLPVHYTFVINFSLFSKVIDLVGGVDVNVEHSFTDNKYPVAGKENALPISSRYQTISFTEGLTHMDGETALKFVRSRNSEGDEGTDFARSRRQHQIIAAIKSKILNRDFLLNKQNITNLLSLLSEHTFTNANQNLYPSFARLAFDSRDQKPKEVVISNTPNPDNLTLLEVPPASKYQNQWVLIAKDNNWQALQQYLQNKLN